MKKDIIEEMREIFVSLETFNLRLSPLEKVVYGMVTLVLMAFGTAMVALIIRK